MSALALECEDCFFAVLWKAHFKDSIFFVVFKIPFARFDLVKFCGKHIVMLLLFGWFNFVLAFNVYEIVGTFGFFSFIHIFCSTYVIYEAVDLKFCEDSVFWVLMKPLA